MGALSVCCPAVMSGMTVSRGRRWRRFGVPGIGRADGPPRSSQWRAERERIEQCHHAGNGRMIGIDPRIPRRRFELRGADGGLHMQHVIHRQRFMAHRVLDEQGIGLVQNPPV